MVDTDDFILNDPDAEKRFEFKLKDTLGNYTTLSIRCIT